MPATMPAKSTILRALEYAEETGQDVRDVYVRLLTLIGIDNPEAVDAAFAEMQTRPAAITETETERAVAAADLRPDDLIECDACKATAARREMRPFMIPVPPGKPGLRWVCQDLNACTSRSSRDY